MTALLGKTLLFAGCTAFGLLRGSRLRQRTACLGEFRRTLAGLARELAFSQLVYARKFHRRIRQNSPVARPSAR